jgi:hypothetical protein
VFGHKSGATLMEGSPYGKCGGGWVGCGEGLRLGAISSQTGTRGGECAGGGFRGIGPALAGNVGAG